MNFRIILKCFSILLVEIEFLGNIECHGYVTAKSYGNSLIELGVFPDVFPFQNGWCNKGSADNG